MRWIRKTHGLLLDLSKRFSRSGLYETLEREAASLPQGASVLNIGAGGPMSAVLKGVGGLDILEVDADPDRAPDMVQDAQSLADLADDSFDMVAAMEVLEHIPEPRRAAAAMQRVLKPGGKLVLSVPFVFGIHDAPHDYYRFTRHGLELLFSEYADVTVRERNDFLHTVLVLFLRLLMAEDRWNRVLGAVAVVAILVTYPLWFLLSRVITSRHITTGYTLIAFKEKRT